MYLILVTVLITDAVVFRIHNASGSKNLFALFTKNQAGADLVSNLQSPDSYRTLVVL